jgi:hypothetical protein
MFSVGDRVTFVTDSTCGGLEPGFFGKKGATGSVENEKIYSYNGKRQVYVKLDKPVQGSRCWYAFIHELDFETKITPYSELQTGDTDEDI